jgi:small subunit ribosomal protein S1
MRLVPFGAFVNAEPGIDGLIHISNMRTGKRINHPREVLEVGQIVEAHVIAVDPENRRLSLSMEPGVTPEKRQPQKIDYPAAGELLTGKVQRVMPFGIFVRLDCGVTGLIPNAEIGTPHGTDHSKMFAPWSEIQIIVTDVDIEHGKVSLSRIEALKKLDMEEFRQYKDTLPQDEAPSHGLGRLGELLRAKMDERKQQD